jgi:AraC family transcriptional regulator of arabinose operon
MPLPNRETPCYPIEVLLADEFRCVPGFGAWRSRGTRDWLLIHTVSGAGLVGTGTREHRVEAGHTVVFQPGTPWSGPSYLSTAKVATEPSMPA